MVVDRYVGSEPMVGRRTPDFVVATIFATQCEHSVVSIFEETRTLHGGYMARLLWQEVRHG